VWYDKSETSTVCWPSKPVHYTTVWPDDRKIVIASKQGSGPLDPGIYGQMANMLVYDQTDPDFPGYNPNEEHTAFFTAQGSEHPGLFPLRTDLNRTNWDDTRRPYTSEPYVLLKYRDPLRYEWNFEVFQVVAQAGTYRMQGGQVVPAQVEFERYYLDENGVLIERSGPLPENSYYIDVDGYVVNPADDVETCYNYSGGNIGSVPCLPVAGVQKHYIDGNGQLQVMSGGPPTPSYSLDKHGVLVESDVYYRFHYADEAGKEINPPYPLNQLTFGPCEESYIYPGDLRWVLKDKDDKFFSRNGGLNGEPATDIVLRYFYRLQAGFWYDLDADGYPDEPVGTPVPLLEGLDGTFDGQTPVDVTYAIRWPDTVPTLFVGETLADAKTQDGETVGLPNIKDQCIVKVLFDQPVEEASGAPNYALHSVNLIDPLKEYSSSDYHLADPENDLPQSLKPEKDLSTNRWMFRTLPYHLQTRLSYDEVEEVLKFKGIYSNITGEPLLLLNVLSDREIYEIEQVFVDDLSSPDPTFMSHVNELQSTGENNLQYPPSGYPEQHFTEMKALTAGDARGTGYVTLAFNNHEDCPAPTMLSVIKVSPDLYRGDIKVFESPNPFAEKVTMRHNGDFGGNADIRYFEWKYRTADFSGIPLGPDNDPPTVWKDYKPQPYDGDPTLIGGANFYISAVDTVIQGTGQQLLPDKWFSVRYHYQAPWGNFTSVWTDPQLYEGWIKRVMKKINLFDQKVKDFHASDVNTIASMIAQAGGRYEGDVALSDEPEYLQGLGIIEVYETLLNRGRSLIGEGDDFADINKALLFASSRLADLYMLEGLEAAADACDPTIGFSTEDGQVGSEASSIFCFQNQVDSLLEEELVLLRGRDDEGVRPVYNRLTWNFAIGNGEP
ncbi:MAG: hypothetical protein JRJ20_15790, partial [Deltaproteobacteria bacterium]|nr:hypothetical protein [Deltaproteobacteria bacterium]